MIEINILEQQIKALKELVSIQEQTIQALKARSTYTQPQWTWHYGPHQYAGSALIDMAVSGTSSGQVATTTTGYIGLTR